MRARQLLAALAMLAGPASGAENTLDLGLNGDAVRAAYVRSFDRPGLQLDGGWLHHQDNGDAVHASLLVVGDAGQRGLEAGLGARLAYVDGEGSGREGYALAPGLRASYTLPRWDRFSLGGEAWFAPDVLAGGDLEEYLDASARAAYAVTRQAHVYVGVRYVRGDFDNDRDTRFDTGLHAGFDISF